MERVARHNSPSGLAPGPGGSNAVLPPVRGTEPDTVGAVPNSCGAVVLGIATIHVGWTRVRRNGTWGIAFLLAPERLSPLQRKPLLRSIGRFAAARPADK